ncbi:MAG TPA: hypothetical protein VGM51_13660 [Armatimonadota bacterium]
MAIAFWILAVALLITVVSAFAAAVPHIRSKEPDVPGTMAADFLPGFALMMLALLAPGGRGMTVQTLALFTIASGVTMYAAIRFGSLSHTSSEKNDPDRK